MCKSEAELTLKLRGLVEGTAIVCKEGGEISKSDPNKWVTVKPIYAVNYDPRGSNGEHYPLLAILYAQKGVHSELVELKKKNFVKKGPRGAFGIPQGYIKWFNEKIIDIEIHDLRKEDSNGLLQNSIPYLMRDGKYAIFQAFSPNYIEKASFSDLIETDRMSWLKTSLLWVLWRSDWGRGRGQERVIEVSIPSEYLSNLEKIAVSTGNSTKQDEAIFQIDPDRVINNEDWLKGRSGTQYWVRANRTKHFGIRGELLKNYVQEIVPKNLRDITSIVQGIESKRPSHAARVLRDELGYDRVYKTS